MQCSGLTEELPIVVVGNSTIFPTGTSRTLGQISVAVAGMLTSAPEDGVST